MKKNTTLYESMVNELFKMLDEFDSNDTKQSQDKYHEACHHGVCDCEHCHDENEDDTEDEYTPNLEVLKYTDEDFKDYEKLENYVDELERLITEFENMSEIQQSIVNALFGNTDITTYIEKLIDHAYEVYDESVKENKKNVDDYSSQTEELASHYVDEVFVPVYTKAGGDITDKQVVAMKNQFKAFADWILKQ